jgi:alkanesulfonate monooxygenase SsuD/methylene tetrahydromethanopterin reductase-like flavin-dependent oxidoreductase (luciferase family)
MARLRSGQPLGPLATIEEAAANVLAPAQQQLVDGMLERWVIDEPVAAAARIRSLADSYGVDEVMVVPGLSAHDSDDPASAPARVKALELLAGQLLS